MKFIHTADIHLGAVPDSTMPWAGERAQEIWDSFYRLLDEAEETETDLLLIAGDLFHRQPLKKELIELNERFAKMKRTWIVMIAGDHDCINPQSYYKDFEWAPNVVFFRKNHISYIQLSSLKLLIYGMSYDREEMTENMYDSLRPMRRFRDGSVVAEDYRHILLAHGGDATHIPMNIHRLRQAGFDYIAMGHLNSPWLDDQALIAYAGALEPIEPDDEGVHGYIRGTIEDGETHIEFVPFAKRSYWTINLTLKPETTMQDVMADIAASLDADGGQDIYQIVLKGVRSLDFALDEAALRKMGKVWSVVDQSLPDVDFEQLYEENKDNMLGLYIRHICEMDISDSLKTKALCYGLKAIKQMQQEV